MSRRSPTQVADELTRLLAIANRDPRRPVPPSAVADLCARGAEAGESADGPWGAALAAKGLPLAEFHALPLREALAVLQAEAGAEAPLAPP